MDISEITSVFGTLFEGIKLVGDLIKDGGDRKEIMDLQKCAIDLQLLCVSQLDEIQREKMRRIKAEEELGKLRDTRMRLSHYHSVEVTPTFSILLKDRDFECGSAEYPKALCACCASKDVIGVLQEIDRGHLPINRSPDALIKCSSCGQTTLVLRSIYVSAIGR